MAALHALYENRFNKLINNKALLYNELKTTNKVPELGNVIVKLDKLGYNFKDAEYNKILSCLLHSNGYILKSYTLMRQNLKDNILEIVFKKFNPSVSQINKLLSIYNGNKGPCYMSWASILIKNGYKFNEQHREKLLEIGFNVLELYDGIVVQEAEMKKVLKSISNMGPYKKGFDYTNKIKTIMDCNKSLINSDMLNYVLSLYKKPCSKIYNDLVKLIVEMPVGPNHETTNIIIKKNITHYDILTLLIDQGLCISNELINYFSKQQETFELVIKLISSKEMLTVDILNNMLRKNQFSSNYNEFVEMIQRFGQYDDLFDRAFDHELSMVNVFIVFTYYGVVPNSETLEIACLNRYIDIIDECTTKYKIVPDKNILDNVLLKLDIYDEGEIEYSDDNFPDEDSEKCISEEYSDEECNIKNTNLCETSTVIGKILCYKIVPDSHSLNNLLLSSYSPKSAMIELLIKYGLFLSLSDVIKITKNQIAIENLERFDIKYDNVLFFWCHMYNFFPNIYIQKFRESGLINSKYLELRLLCREKSLTPKKLVDYLNQNNIKIDGYSLEMAAHCNEKIAQYMLKELNCFPTPNICYWLYSGKKDHHLLDKIISLGHITDEVLSKAIQN